MTGSFQIAMKMYSSWTKVIVGTPKYPQNTPKSPKFEVSKIAILTCTAQSIKMKIISIASREPSDTVISIFMVIFMVLCPVELNKMG